MMAVEARFACGGLKRYHHSISAPLISMAGFHLQIRKFIQHHDDSLQEDEAAKFEDVWLLPEFLFGGDRNRSRVAQHLRQAGWSDQPSLEAILDSVFSEAESILLQDKTNRGLFSNKIPIIKLCVKKLVKCEDELQAMAVESSMQQVPKPIPATKESVQALKKVKLEVEDHIAQDYCMICMEQLCYGTKDDVITSMPCSHLFHGDCIQQWLNTNHTCPLCRFPMPTNC